MLFAYQFQQHPLRDLHTSVRAFIRALHRDGLNPAHFDVEKCCTGELLARAKAGDQLMEKLETFYAAWFELTQTEQLFVRRAFVITNRVRYQVTGIAPRVPLGDLPVAIRKPAHDLFVHLYEKSLTKARCKSHWEQSYARLPLKICPFCGVEILHHPDLLKQDYDHLLCKKHYPFASVNILNLVPCGRDCNQVFKHEKDMIWDEQAGIRRRAFYPFRDHGYAISVSLTGSALPTMDHDPGRWEVSFHPDVDEVRTWVDVFELRDRYRLEVFPVDYDQWREDFLDWLGPQASPAAGWDAAIIRARMTVYSKTLEAERFKDKRFLKLALFQFLFSEAADGFFAALASQLNAQSRNN